MEQDNMKDILVIGLKVLAGVAISTVWFFVAPFAVLVIYFEVPYIDRIVTDGSIGAVVMWILLSALASCIIDLLTNKLLKKLFVYPEWVYVVQSTNFYLLTIIGSMAGGDGTNPTLVPMCISLLSFTAGGALLSAGINKLISMRRKR